jgi:hypothetical protein
MTVDQANELLKELRRLNDTMLNIAQVQMIPVLKDPKNESTMKTVQDLPAPRKPNFDNYERLFAERDAKKGV